MNERDIIATLKRLQGEASAPLHHATLRRALVAVHAPHTFVATLRTPLTFIVVKKYYMPVGALAAVALVVGLTLNPVNPELAQAQEQVARAFTRAIQISPEMRAELEAKMKADMLETLEEAKAAPDLRILTKEEFEAESPFTISKAPAFAFTRIEGEVPSGAVFAGEGMEAGTRIELGPNAVDTFTIELDGDTPVVTEGAVAVSAFNATPAWEAMEPVKYLSYTDPRGSKTVLGLDENDTPVFKFSELKVEDIVNLENGMVGVRATNVVEFKAIQNH